MLNEEEIERGKHLTVICAHCFYYNLRSDPLVFRSKCNHCKLLNCRFGMKLKEALSDSLFEPSDEWILALRTVIKNHKEKEKIKE